MTILVLFVAYFQRRTLSLLGQWLWLISDTNGPQFESRHFLEQLFTVNCIEKTKIKKKRPGMDHLKTPPLPN